MINKIKNAVLSIGAFTVLVLGLSVLITPAESVHACNGDSNPVSFFELRPWHHYLDCPGGDLNQDISLNDTWVIAVAVLESLLRIAAILSIGYIIWGGFKYMTSQGSPDGTASARRTIIYSIVGLVVTVFATVGVSFAMNVLRGGNNELVNGLPNPGSTDNVVGNVLNFVYALAGIVAAIYIAIGGLNFTTSTGDPQKAANARNTLIYAVVGLVVVLCAYLITGAVLNRVG